MEVISRSEDALFEDLVGVVFAGFHFVADHRHFGVEIFLEHGHADHAVGFESERPAQIVVAGVEGLEVHGLVVLSGAVEQPPPWSVSSLKISRPGGGRLEHHVFEEMGHACLAVSLVAGADAVDDVDGDFGLGVIGKQQDVETVGKAYSVTPSMEVTF